MVGWGVLVDNLNVMNWGVWNGGLIWIKKRRLLESLRFFVFLRCVDEADEWSEEFLEVFEASEGDEFRDYVEVRGGRYSCPAVGEGEE